jgi:hypothetical protein
MKHVDEGLADAKRASQKTQQGYNAALRGDASKAEEQLAEADDHAKKALGHAADAVLDGAQIPGTSAAGPVGFGKVDAAAAIVTTVVVEASKKQMENQRKKEDAKGQAEQDAQKQEKKKKKNGRTFQNSKIVNDSHGKPTVYIPIPHD